MNFADLIAGQTTPMGPGAPKQQLAPVVQPTAAPPGNPEEMAQRVSGWQGFLDRLRSDPALQHSLLMAGASMLSGPQMGENTANVMGRALQVGALSHMTAKQQQAAAALARQKEARATATADAQIGHYGALGKRAEERTAIEKGRLDKDKLVAEATIANQEQNRKFQEQLVGNTLATGQSQRALNSARIANLDKPAGGGTKPSTQDALFAAYSKAYPEETEQQLWQRVVERGQKLSGSDEASLTSQVNALTKIQEIADPKSPEYKAASKKLMKLLDLEGEEAPSVGQPATPAQQPIDEQAFREAAKKADENGVFLFNGKKWQLN